MSYVKIEHVIKSYGNQQVLKNISLSIEKGEFITLLGPSGCGKSTLLRAIAGLNDIDSGRIYVDEQDMTPLPPRERNVGMVFQSYALFPNMNVFHNIAFGLKMDGMKKEQYSSLVREMIELIDLQGKEGSYPHQLSGGQQQRVALGRALVKQPNILLLDEPLSALDAKIRRTLRTEIRKIQQRLNMTTVFVTHDQEEALTISDRIFVMNEGKIEQAGTPEEIYTSPQTEFVARFIGSYNVLGKADMERAGFKLQADETMFAVRPEAIRIMKEDTPFVQGDDREWMIGTGWVRQVTVLGNVIRFDAEMQGVHLTVDAIHDPDHYAIKADTSVRLAIPREECKPLKNEARE